MILVHLCIVCKAFGVFLAGFSVVSEFFLHVSIVAKVLLIVMLAVILRE